MLADLSLLAERKRQLFATLPRGGVSLTDHASTCCGMRA